MLLPGTCWPGRLRSCSVHVDAKNALPRTCCALAAVAKPALQMVRGCPSLKRAFLWCLLAGGQSMDMLFNSTVQSCTDLMPCNISGYNFYWSYGPWVCNNTAGGRQPCWRVLVALSAAWAVAIKGWHCCCRCCRLWRRQRHQERNLHQHHHWGPRQPVQVWATSAPVCLDQARLPPSARCRSPLPSTSHRSGPNCRCRLKDLEALTEPCAMADCELPYWRIGQSSDCLPLNASEPCGAHVARR